MEMRPADGDEGEARPRLAGEALLAAIVESSDDAILAKTLDGTILSWNRGAETLYGRAAEEMIGRNVVDLVPPDRQEELDDILSRLASGERIRHHETQRQRKDGTLVDVSVTISPVIDDSGVVVGASAIARDISERKHLERLLTHQPLHDPLTNLPNRILLEDRLGVALAAIRRSGHKVAVLFVDLDLFKAVNDRHGHAAGDRVLEAAAARLVGALRPADTVGRFGGDEFVVVCPDVADLAEAVVVGERLLSEVSRPYDLDIGHQQLTASIGMALGSVDDDPPDLIRRADAAMYAAKAAGRSRLQWASDPGAEPRGDPPTPSDREAP